MVIAPLTVKEMPVFTVSVAPEAVKVMDEQAAGAVTVTE
jgi:hypothetical protein